MHRAGNQRLPRRKSVKPESLRPLDFRWREAPELPGRRLPVDQVLAMPGEPCGGLRNALAAPVGVTVLADANNRVEALAQGTSGVHSTGSDQTADMGG
jgi:hypothetical protein